MYIRFNFNLDVHSQVLGLQSAPFFAKSSLRDHLCASPLGSEGGHGSFVKA